MINKSSFFIVTVSIMTAATFVLGGCAAKSATDTSQQPVVITEKAPGVVQEVWEEPMVDVVDVPPGLDPEGVYYRPGHQEVVEIRQGRWQYYKDNNK